MAELASMEDEYELLEALGPNAVQKLPGFSVGNIGKKTSFDCDVKELQARVREAGDAVAAVGAEVANACARRLGSAIRRFTLDAAVDRQRAGQLEFHDLLVLARALLRHPEHGPAVRAALHERYRHLLLDEFQDTDPIQIELAVRIAAADPGSAAGQAPRAGPRCRRASCSWWATPSSRSTGSVGPTFRRSWPAERFGSHGGGVGLTTNFRTVRPVIDWVNRDFATLMTRTDAVDLPGASQPRYVALDADRCSPPMGPPVAVLGAGPPSQATLADGLRAAEADEVRHHREDRGRGWSVDDGHGGWRAARLGDITVLVPARTSLPFLEDAFDRGDRLPG